MKTSLITIFLLVSSFNLFSQIYDAGISQIIAPHKNTLCSSQNLTVKVKNFSTSNMLPIANIQYSVNGIVSIVNSYNINLAPNADTTITLGIIALNPGTNTLSAWAWYDPILNNDANPLNDTSNKTIQLLTSASVNSISTNNLFCQNDSAKFYTLDTSSNFTYQWQIKYTLTSNWTNISSATNDTLKVTNLSGTTRCYRVILKDIICNATLNSDSICFTIQTNPTAISSTVTQLCMGDSILLSSAVTNALTYQWYKNSVAIPGATNATFYATQVGTYKLITTYANSCNGTSNSITISTFNTSVTTTSSIFLCQGDTATLHCSSANTYQWFFNNSLITGAVNQNYLASQMGTYYCLANLGSCIDTTNTLFLSITPLVNASITAANSSNAICQGDSLKLTCNSTNVYQWYLNGTILNGAEYQHFYATQAGNYVCVINSTSCVDTSNILAISMANLPATPIITLNSGVLSCSSMGVSYQWYLNGVAISGATNQTFTPSQNGNYYVVIADLVCNSLPSNSIVFSSVGLHNVEKNSPIYFYPNPSQNGIFFIDNKYSSPSISFSIYNSIGIKINEGKIQKHNSSIDLSQQAKGLYFIHFNINNKNEIATLMYE